MLSSCELSRSEAIHLSVFGEVRWSRFLLRGLDRLKPAGTGVSIIETTSNPNLSVIY